MAHTPSIIIGIVIFIIVGLIVGLIIWYEVSRTNKNNFLPLTSAALGRIETLTSPIAPPTLSLPEQPKTTLSSRPPDGTEFIIEQEGTGKQIFAYSNKSIPMVGLSSSLTPTSNKFTSKLGLLSLKQPSNPSKDECLGYYLPTQNSCSPFLRIDPSFCFNDTDKVAYNKYIYNDDHQTWCLTDDINGQYCLTDSGIVTGLGGTGTALILAPLKNNIPQSNQKWINKF
jgi:hypothetical protein